MADLTRSITNQRNTTITDSNVIPLNKPEVQDPLQEIQREGARQLLANAIEAEIKTFLAEKNSDGKCKATIVRNGYLPERTIQTGLGYVAVEVPKTRDRSQSGIKFTSSLIPPYLKRIKSIEEFLPWLYLRGISTGDFSESLKHLLGAGATGLSAGTISRLKQDCTTRYLSKKRYAYIWADGIHSHVRMDDRLCLLVIIGSDEKGNKEFIALSDGYRKSAASWEETLLDLTQRGLKQAPELAVGDGALVFGTY